MTYNVKVEKKYNMKLRYLLLTVSWKFYAYFQYTLWKNIRLTNLCINNN